MEIFLLAEPSTVREAAFPGVRLAHAAYRIGADSALFCRSLLLQTKGGLLVLTDAQAPAVESPETLASELLRQCRRRDYGGVVLDFEEAYREDLGLLAKRLETLFSREGRRLYLPPSYAPAAPAAQVIVNTAVSGGSFADYLQEQCRQLGGPGRIALDVQRMRVRFALPEGSGEGETLEPQDLAALMEMLHPAVFFSRDLCAKYFTYSREGVSCFVLFDDAATLRQKLDTARQMGIPSAFFQWPEVRDIAPALFGEGQAVR